MRFDISVTELIDLQSALRRASRATSEMIEMFSVDDKAPNTVACFAADLERFNALHERLEQTFDATYPPASDDAA